MNDAHSLQAAHADPVIDARGLDKIYTGGFQALKDINLTVRRGKGFTLLVPTGAATPWLITWPTFQA